ncbi:MAG: hypothetical protein V7L25_07085 [Nostoc sp.]
MPQALRCANSSPLAGCANGGKRPDTLLAAPSLVSVYVISFCV